MWNAKWSFTYARTATNFMTKTDVENIYQKRKGDNKMNELHNFNNGEMDAPKNENTIQNREVYFRQGFVEDADHEILREALSKRKKFSELSMTISATDPNVLFSRTKEKKVTVEINTAMDERLIIIGNDKYKTRIMNILVDEIEDCLICVNENRVYELQFFFRGLRYGVKLFI